MGNFGQSNYGYANCAMEQICEQRARDGLTAKAIEWGLIADVGFAAEALGNDATMHGTKSQRLPSFFKALDQFLVSSHVICQSHVPEDLDGQSLGRGGDLLSKICHILGIRDLSNVDSSKTLTDLGMDSLMMVEVRFAIEKECGIILPQSQIPKLTIDDIKQMSSAKVEEKHAYKLQQSQEEIPSDLGKVSLREKFYFPTQPFTILNSENPGPAVYFCPPNHLGYNLAEPVLKSMNRRVIRLDWQESYLECSCMKDVAAMHIEVLLSINESNDDGSSMGYDLIGYSFGGVLAFEMAIQLQRTGRPVNSLIFLDSSPYITKAFWKNGRQRLHFPVNARDWDIIVALANFLHEFAGLEVTTMSFDQLIQINDDQKRYEHTARIFTQTLMDTGRESELIGIDQQSLIKTIQSYCKKGILAAEYQVTSQYEGDALLIRAQDSFYNPFTKILTEDYGLSRAVTGSCKVYHLPGDHETFLSKNSSDIIEIISSHID